MDYKKEKSYNITDNGPFCMKTEYTLDHFHITRYKLGSLCTKFKGNRRISAYVYKLGTYLGLCAYFIPKAYNICQVTNCGPVQLKTKYILDLFTLLGTNLDLFTHIMKKILEYWQKVENCGPYLLKTK